MRPFQTPETKDLGCPYRATYTPIATLQDYSYHEENITVLVHLSARHVRSARTTASGAPHLGRAHVKC